jgi:hypothetical protein
VKSTEAPATSALGCYDRISKPTGVGDLADELRLFELLHFFDGEVLLLTLVGN